MYVYTCPPTYMRTFIHAQIHAKANKVLSNRCTASLLIFFNDIGLTAKIIYKIGHASVS